MKLECKICGISDSKTLNFLINYKYPPELIGFICNYPKSKRFVDINSLQKLLKVDNKKSQFVSVLVKPDQLILNEMQNLKDLLIYILSRNFLRLIIKSLDLYLFW